MILSKFKQQIGLNAASDPGSLLPAVTALAQTEAVTVQRPAQLPDR